MCGILGMLSNKKTGFFPAEADAFFGMLAVTALRGKDSTGVFGVTEQNDVSWYKSLGNPFNFVDWNKISIDFRQDFLNNYKGVIGHCRYATIGDVNVSNAHPFQQENITLVHNGTIQNHYSLQKEFGGEVDSETICNMIHKIGIEETLSRINGAYALVYYDSDTKLMNCIRNSERELWIKSYNNGESIILASEYYTMDWAVDRYKLTGADKPRYLEVDRLYSFPLDSIHKYNSKKLEIVKKAPPNKYYVPSLYLGEDADWEMLDGDVPDLGRQFRDYRLGQNIDIDFNDAPLIDSGNMVCIFGKPYGDKDAPIQITSKMSLHEFSAIKRQDFAKPFLNVLDKAGLTTWQDEAVLLMTSIPKVKATIVGIRYLGDKGDKFELFVKPTI